MSWDYPCPTAWGWDIREGGAVSVPPGRAQGLPGTWWVFSDYELNDLMVPLWTFFVTQLQN